MLKIIDKLYTHEVSPDFSEAHAYGGIIFNVDLYMRGAGFGYGWGIVDTKGGGVGNEHA